MSQYDYDWDEIRKMYESGITPAEISRILGGRPTRQAISKRAKKEGWTVNPLVAEPGVVNDFIVPSDLPVKKQAVLMFLKAGGQTNQAHLVADVDRSTWNRWLKDEWFASLVGKAQLSTTMKVVECALRGAAQDPKYAWEWLKNHPVTRGDYGPPAKHATQIGQIKIGHLIQRDPAHRVPHLIDQDDTSTDSVDEDAAEVEPVNEPKKIESQEPDIQPEKIEQPEPVKPEQVISTDTQEALGRSAFDIQFRKERGIKDDD